FHDLIPPLVFISWLADHFYYTKGGLFFLRIAKAFWNHRHCRWFSVYKKSNHSFHSIEWLLVL
ncbi:MAG: hypothetical protein IJ039_03030, partial [Clostridia bacterium]|nr:hypothetical protein [Clostridia bacterium]